jgi:hypothetical protein
MEVAAQGPESDCRVPPEAERTDLGKLWIPEEIGCRLQRDNPPVKSGMAQGKCHQEKSDQRQHDVRNLEKMDIQEEASAETRLKNGIRTEA